MSDSEVQSEAIELTEEQEEFNHKELCLKNRIKSLEQENIQMKTQISQVQNYADKLAKLQGDHMTLKRENGELLNRVADLEHRLEYINEDKKELEQELEKERQNHQNSRSEEYQSMTKKIDSSKAEYEQKIEQLNQTIAKLEQEISNGDIKAKINNSKNDRLLQSAERYFDDSVSSIDELIKIFEQPAQRAQQPVSPSPVKYAQSPMRMQQNDDNSAALKRLKQKNRALKVKYAELTDQLDKEAEENKKQSRAYQSEIKTLKNQMTADKEEAENERTKMNRQISQLQGHVDNLTILRTRNQTEIVEPVSRGLPYVAEQPKFATPKAVAKFFTPKKEMNDDEEQANMQKTVNKQAKMIETLQKEISEGNQKKDKQLKEATKKEEELTDNIKAFKAENNAFASENNALKVKVEALTTLNKEMENQIETLRNALHAKAPVEDQKQKPQQPSKNIKAMIKKLQGEAEDLNKKILEQQATINSRDNEIDELKKNISDVANRADVAEEKVRQITMDLHESEEKAQKIPKPTPSEILPQEAWQSNGWSSELAATISEIASNQSLQPQSKLQHVFNEIQAYYNKLIDSQQKQISQMENEAKIIRSKVNEFLVNSSIALNDSSITFDKFINSNVGQEIVACITQLRNEADEYRIANEQSLSVVDYVVDAFEFETDDTPQLIISQVDEIKERIKKQTQQFEATIKKMKHYKRSLKELDSSTKSLVANLKEENQRLSDENEEISEKYEAAKKQLQETHMLNEELTAQIEETITERDMNILNEKDRNEKEIESLHMEYSQREAELQGEYNKTCEKLAEVSEALENEESKSSTLETKLQAANEELKQVEEKLEKTIEDNQKNAEEAEEKAKEEKECMKKEFDATIETLKEQYHAIQSDLENVATQLSKSESKSKTLRQTVYKLQDYKERSIEEKKRLESQMERERLLSDAQTRSRIIEEQAKMNEKILEQQSKSEEDKIRIFNHFTSKFRKFSNPMKATDEREFKASIERVYDEYNRLSTSDAAVRKMLNARDKQTTEDAVAQVLVSRK